MRVLTSDRSFSLPFSINSLPPILLAIGCVIALSGCSSTPEEQAREDIRDTTIIPNLGSYDEQIQQEAVSRMLSILDKAPKVGANILAATLDDPVPADRTKMVCAWLLSTIQDRRALPTLMRFLAEGASSQDSLIRESVVVFGPSVIPSVAAVLEEGNDVARTAAAEVLYELDSRAAVDALVSRLAREPEPSVRFLILCGVAAENPPRVAVLEGALTDPDPSNRELAWDTLDRLFRLPPSLAFDAEGSDTMREEQLERYRAWRAARGGAAGIR